MDEPTTTRFVAVLLSHSSSQAQGYVPLWSEDLVLIHADSPEEARTRAAERGRAAATSYRNDRGESIVWTFDRVVDVAPLLDEDLAQDADLYTRHFRDHDAYVRFDRSLTDEP
ncbi:DUF4288 domain-containing protein [Arsenicicoccus dermatophilus]|uniref:DUF4288 domain-containing protein n=1 Tax=Arsenicicoccus dermatophilus TaxID=1076331 RepID=UPI001F4C636A|nr:DUF4288 domain-containing protein [Arsenicicoccus dermatophilus]MCH8614166.1 DUF4288 domain-containing protein [Arsenicicoccus dermatophilus]